MLFYAFSPALALFFNIVLVQPEFFRNVDPGVMTFRKIDYPNDIAVLAHNFNAHMKLCNVYNSTSRCCGSWLKNWI
jgi:hypothetical protein